MLRSVGYDALIAEIDWLMSTGRSSVVTHIHRTMVVTYRHIGKHIVEYEQQWSDRAQYGKKLFENLSRDLTKKYWNGYSERNLQKHRQFFLEFPDFADSVGEIHLLWRSHIVRLLRIKQKDERAFFVLETAKEKRSVRELDRQIQSGLYHRIALSTDKEKVATLSKKWQELINAEDVIKDSYVLEFLWLGSKSAYSEKDLETAILSQLQMFLLELWKWFSFVARQKRLRTDTNDFYVDLVFYNRILQCHLLIDLKIWTLTHQDLGQMQMYVNRYNRKEKLNHEWATIWLVLCRENDDIVLEYTLPEWQNAIYAKEYQLYLPSKDELKEYLDTHMQDQ